jgi:hypothetical protein
MTRRSFFAGLIGVAAAAVAGPRRDRFRVYAARVTHRFRAPLEAVGVDWDGAPRRLDDLAEVCGGRIVKITWSTGSLTKGA